MSRVAVGNRVVTPFGGAGEIVKIEGNAVFIKSGDILSRYDKADIERENSPKGSKSPPKSTHRWYR